MPSSKASLTRRKQRLSKLTIRGHLSISERPYIPRFVKTQHFVDWKSASQNQKKRFDSQVTESTLTTISPCRSFFRSLVDVMAENLASRGSSLRMAIPGTGAKAQPSSVRESCST